MKTTIRDITRSAALSCLLATAATAYGGEIRYTLQLDPSVIETDTINAPDGTPYLRLWAPDCDYVGEPGEPMIPYKCINFLVPTYSNNFTVTVDNVTVAESRTLGLPLYPVQEPQTVNDYDPEKFTPPTVLSSEQHIGNMAKIIDEYVVNGDKHIVSVAVPTVYLEQTSDINDNCQYEAFVYQDAVLSLTYNECSDDELFYVPFSSSKSSQDIDISTHVVNSDKSMQANSIRSIDYEESFYYILVPEYLKESVNDIALWKRQKGHKVEVVTVEDILADSRYDVVSGHASFDSESHIRNWIISEKKRIGSFQLLIVGDDISGAPVRKFMSSSSTDPNSYNSEYNGENYVPTDGYFSDVTSKFILEKQNNGYYSGLMRSQPFSPCIPVGRILANKSDELSIYTRKLLIYELDPGFGDSEYLDHAMAFFQSDMLHEKSMIPFVPHFGTVTNMQDQRNQDTYMTNRPTGKDVIDVMKTCGFMSLHGHGSPITIACSGRGDYKTCYRYIKAHSSYTMSDTGFDYDESGNGLDNLENYNKPAVAYSISCTICPFEKYQPSDRDFRDGLYNMGSGFTVAGDYGGVAFIGNTRNGIISTSDNLEQAFGKSVNNGYNLGMSFVKSGLAYNAGNHCRYTRCLIGDPDINMWLGSPDKLDVNLLYDGLKLSFNGSDLDNMKAVIFNGQDNPSIEYFNGEDAISFDINNLKSKHGDDFTVSLFKNNKLPIVYLMADQSNISSSKKYFLEETHLANPFDESRKCFNVMEGGSLTLTSTRNFETTNAFEITEGGFVKLKSLSGSILLKEDNIKKGGRMDVCAKDVRLDSGFTVELGGELTISPAI